MSAYNKLFLVQEHYFAADCEVTDTKGHDNIHIQYIQPAQWYCLCVV